MEADNVPYVTFGLVSDGRVLYWGDAFPVAFYEGAQDAAGDQCFRTLSRVSGMGAGLSYDRSFTVFDLERQPLPDSPYTAAQPTGVEFVQIVGWLLVAALDSDGTVWVMREEETEFEMLPLPSAAEELDAQAGGVCARLSSGDVWCYSPGHDPSGMYGLGLDASLDKFTRLPLEHAAVDFEAASFATCYLDSLGVARCSGSNLNGELGLSEQDFPETDRLYFDEVPGLPPLRELFGGANSFCGFDLQDGLWCWGGNVLNSLIDAPDDSPIVATRVGTFPGVTDISLSVHTACVLFPDGTVGCRGASAFGLEHCSNYGLRDGWRIIDLSVPCGYEP